MPAQLHAQYVEEHKVDSSSNFYKILHTVLSNADKHFFELIQPSTDSNFTQDSWEVKSQYHFDASHSTSVEKKGNAYVYRAVFLSKDNRDELVSSYNNLISQIRESMPYNYAYKEKKNPVYKVYDCSIKPDTEGIYAAPSFRVFIEEDWINRHYSLVLEIKSVEK